MNGRDVVVQVGDTRVEGHCLGLAENGGLRVLTGNGPVELRREHLEFGTAFD
ncbi:MAG: hypothetical protein U0894_15080 [Pirellulales bacterium]